MRMHLTDQSSVTTKCVPLFHSKNANNDDNDKIMDYNKNNKLME